MWSLLIPRMLSFHLIRSILLWQPASELPTGQENSPYRDLTAFKSRRRPTFEDIYVSTTFLDRCLRKPSLISRSVTAVNTR